MTYLVNGTPVILNEAAIITEIDHLRYSIAGVSSIEGDHNMVIISNQSGPVRKGEFTSERGGLTLQIGLKGFGSGSYSITELTDKYAKGRFHFVSVANPEEGEKQDYVITDGRFKAKILEPMNIK